MSPLLGADTPSWLAPYLPEGNGWFLAVGVILLTVFSAIISLVAVAFALTRLPPDYFVNPHAHRPIDRHPVLKILLILLRNFFGYFLVALGILLSLPGVPGQGLLTIFLGVLLIDFPGKLRVLRWFLTRRGVLEGINRLRSRFGHPPLLHPHPSDPLPNTPVHSSPNGDTSPDASHGADTHQLSPSGSPHRLLDPADIPQPSTPSSSPPSVHT